MSCLIIKNDGIGDLILASGLISAVGKIFGGNLDLLTCSDNQEIAGGIDSVREHFFVSRDEMHFSGFAQRFGLLLPRAPRDDLYVLQALAARHYDTVICLRRYIRQSTLVVMSKVRANNKFCAWEFPTNATLSMAERISKDWVKYSTTQNILSELTYNKSYLEHVLETSINTLPHLSFCRKQTSKPHTRKVALGIGGASTNWPQENWLDLTMQLAADDWNLVLLGGSDAFKLAEHIVAKVAGAENLVGQLTWHDTAELLYDCEAYIGNDTGLSHFASLIVQKCMVILGGGTFRRFFPWPDAENQHVIYHGLDCFDCDWDCKFNDRTCLNLVQPLDVVNYLQEVMKEETKPERDLNIDNKEYQVSWRRKIESRKSFIRG